MSWRTTKRYGCSIVQHNQSVYTWLDLHSRSMFASGFIPKIVRIDDEKRTHIFGASVSSFAMNKGISSVKLCRKLPAYIIIEDNTCPWIVRFMSAGNKYHININYNLLYRVWPCVLPKDSSAVSFEEVFMLVLYTSFFAPSGLPHPRKSGIAYLWTPSDTETTDLCAVSRISDSMNTYMKGFGTFLKAFADSPNVHY